jgi:acyl-CoA dehydrogenase
MMINLELPENIEQIRQMSRQVALQGLRPISRKYDLLEQKETPEELYALQEMLKPSIGRVGASATASTGGNRNGANMAAVTFIEQMCWGDLGLTSSLPMIGLGNAAVEAVANENQKAQWGDLYAAMAITEPGCGSDSAAIKTTAKLDGDEWVINGEKIFVTDGYRCKQVVVWASLDTSLGKAAIKSFLVPKGTPGMSITRISHKLGIRANDHAQILFDNCRVPKGNILGDPNIARTAEERKKAFGGVMQTFDNTRPQVAGQGLGIARAALDMTSDLLQQHGQELNYDKGYHEMSAVENDLYELEAEYEAARLLVLKAAWMADNKQPNSKNASMSKAKAGRMVGQVALKCVEICGQLGYSKADLLEKFARDAKIVDIYEGTQQINQLIVARQVLGKSSKELK